MCGCVVSDKIGQ